MKGLAVWMWLIAGVIVGMIMFVMFFQLMSYLTLSRARENAKENFESLTSEINAMCESRSGSQSIRKFSFPDSVSIVYSTTDPKVFAEKNNRTFGKFACMKFQKEQICEALRCDSEFNPIRNKESLLGVLDTLLGNSNYQEHTVKLTKTECGISVLNMTETPSQTCGLQCRMTSLIKCESATIGALVNKSMFVYSDMTRMERCCDNSDDVIKLLTNVATYFGGKRILIVWEIDRLDPFLPNHLPINDSLNSKGFSVTSFRHSSPISFNMLRNYDQVWLYRPGWCDSRLDPCKGTIPWGLQEEQDVVDYFGGGGKVFLVTDTSPTDSNIQLIVNDLLKKTNQTAAVEDACICGCGDKETKTSDIAKHPITDGLTDIGVIAATKITCQ